jgi:hypothetical protein
MDDFCLNIVSRPVAPAAQRKPSTRAQRGLAPQNRGSKYKNKGRGGRPFDRSRGSQPNSKPDARNDYGRASSSSAAAASRPEASAAAPAQQRRTDVIRGPLAVDKADDSMPFAPFDAAPPEPDAQPPALASSSSSALSDLNARAATRASAWEAAGTAEPSSKGGTGRQGGGHAQEVGGAENASLAASSRKAAGDDGEGGGGGRGGQKKEGKGGGGASPKPASAHEKKRDKKLALVAELAAGAPATRRRPNRTPDATSAPRLVSPLAAFFSSLRRAAAVTRGAGFLAPRVCARGMRAGVSGGDRRETAERESLPFQNVQRWF